MVKCHRFMHPSFSISLKIQAHTVGASCLTSSVRVDVAEGKNRVLWLLSDWKVFDCLWHFHLLNQLGEEITWFLKRIMWWTAFTATSLYAVLLLGPELTSPNTGLVPVPPSCLKLDLTCFAPVKSWWHQIKQRGKVYSWLFAACGSKGFFWDRSWYISEIYMWHIHIHIFIYTRMYVCICICKLIY